MSVVTPREPAEREAPRAPLAITQQARLVQRWSHLVAAAASCPGKRHVVNEDSHSDLASGAPVFVVADGVGGGAMAAWASRQVVKRLHSALAARPIDGDAIRDALLEADRDVGRGIARRTARSGATTVALCAGTGSFLPRWYIGWVGDCRIYRLSRTGETVELLTRDDTYRNLGERPPPGGSVDDPARMVGNGAVGTPNVQRIDLRFGEALLLCSDGVYKHVSSDEIAGAFAGASPLAERCVRLLEVARSHGSADDATALVVRHDRRARSPLWRYALASALLLLLSAVFLALAPQWEAAPAGSTPVMSSQLHPEFHA